MDWKKAIKTGLDQWLQLCATNQKFKDIETELTTLRADIEDELTIMISGEFNAGKSTFINALLGEKVLSSDVTPETAMVTKLTYGEKRKVIAHYLNGKSQVYDDVWLEQLTAEREGRFKSIRHQLSHVELQIPIELLKNHTIIDTPGLNANNEYHTNATERFLARTDFAIFLFHAMNVGTATEINWLKKFNDVGIQPFGVINRIDELDEEEDDLEGLIDFNKPRIGPAVQELIGVSARDALNGQLQKNEQLLHWSNWGEIQTLLTKIKNNKNRKLERVYSRLLPPLRKLDELCLNWKFSLPLKKIDEQKVHSFLSNDYQELLSSKEQLNEQKNINRSVHSKWSSFLDTSVYTLDGMNQFLLGFVEAYGESETSKSSPLPFDFLANWEETVTIPYRQFDENREVLNDKVEELDEYREKLVQEWKTIQYTNQHLFRKGKLEKHQRKLQYFNEEREELSQKRDALNSVFNQITKQRKNTQELITSLIGADLQFHLEKEENEVLRWNQKLGSIQGNFSTLTPSDISNIQEFSDWLHDFEQNVASYLNEPGQLLENYLPFEEVKYLFGNMAELGHDIPSNEFFKNWSELSSLKKEVISNFEVAFPDFTPSELRHHELKLVSNELKHPVQAEIQAELANRNLWIKRGAATIFISLTIGGIVYANGTEEDSYEEISEYEDDEDYSSVPVLNVEDEEELLEEAKLELERQFPREEVEYFIRNVKTELGQYPFYSEDYFTTYGWESFSPYNDLLSSGDSGTMELVSIEYLSRTDLVAKMKESFTQSGVLKEFETNYTITLDSYGFLISNFTYTLLNETEIEIPLGEGEMQSFLSGFYEYYMQALNTTDESYIYPYFETNSSAPESLYTYIQSIVGKYYRYEDAQLQVDSVNKIGTNEYQVMTTEQFLLTDDQGELTWNERTKEYVVKLVAESTPVITSIETTDSKKEKVIVPTVQLVDNQGIYDFFYSYYTSFQNAFNGDGFSYVSSYYDPEGAAYNNAESYISNAISKSMGMNNLDMSIETISELDDHHYEVKVYFEDEYSYQDGTGDRKKVRATYKIRVTEDADVLIVDNPNVEILENIEL
ncbi:isoniazid inductible protein IniC [Mycobacteroides abscessus subsp. abscessus]|nr:isoniazid inductible protein IniC [Mycobacteroides abscessus subsp. abscessus]